VGRQPQLPQSHPSQATPRHRNAGTGAGLLNQQAGGQAHTTNRTQSQQAGEPHEHNRQDQPPDMRQPHMGAAMIAIMVVVSSGIRK